MKITIVTTGEPHLSFARSGIDEYYKRIQGFANVELVFVKENKKMEDKILSLMEKKYSILMDEQGKQYSSEELSLFLEKKKNQGENLCFIIGGPDGHTQKVREKAQMSLSLSTLTFPHDLATLLTVETLYRSLSILSNHPYHRP
jgi:23S rRNA (pseudouridine1915-N3)-methyltransferase